MKIKNAVMNAVHALLDGREKELASGDYPSWKPCEYIFDDDGNDVFYMIGVVDDFIWIAEASMEEDGSFPNPQGPEAKNRADILYRLRFGSNEFASIVQLFTQHVKGGAQ